MSRVEVKLPPVPSELKSISPFTSRAQELSGKDPVIAYYCLYHAITTGMSANAKGKDVTPFLTSLMTVLETMKDQLKDRKEINSHEAAAVYIEAFALKVFSNADNEDRKGGSNRSTAKKFLAASNFFELLTMFDAKLLNPLIEPEEKIKYAKWKAADIAKAYREGRVPLSGPATTLDGSEDDFTEIHASSHSEVEDASMGSSSGAAVAPLDDSKFSYNQATRTGAITPPTDASTLKPYLSTKESSSSTKTITHAKNPSASLTPKHISTASTTPSPYVVDLSSPATSGPKTPLKSAGVSDGLWSTAATPGIDSPNVFPGALGGSGGRAALSHLNPASIALFNATLGAAKGDSPISPVTSPKPKSSLGASVITASNIGAPGAPRKQGDDDGIDTDEEDGQWSTAGNDPFSRQNSMMPPSSSTSFSSGHPPSLTVTSSLGVLHEEASPQSTPQKQPRSTENQTTGSQNLVTPSALNAPLPPSASNTAPSSPDARLNSITYATSRPLPSALPPATRTPSSIKSDSHVLPTEDTPNKHWKITSSVVGDSMSDGEASYHVRRRANSSSTGQPPNSAASRLGAADRHGSHIRSSSVNTASVSTNMGPVSTNGREAKLAIGKGGSVSSADDDWEKASLSRLARLPDSVTGSDMDSLSGRLRDLGDSESESATPTISDDRAAATSGSSDFKSRRNTIKANAPYDPQLSGSDFGFTLPGVPSAPPVGDWGSGSGKGDSDSGGEGDVMARMPSAPAIPPLVQDQLPHVTIFAKPAIPKENLHVNPHFPTVTPTNSASAPPPDLESPSTPRSQTNSQTHSASSLSGQQATLINAPPPPPPPPVPPFGYQQPPPPSTTSSNATHPIHLGYTPPNSVISPHSNFTTSMPPVPTQHIHQFLPSTGMAHSIPPSVYASNGYVNGSVGSFGPPVNIRTPPTEVDIETLAKAQKHTKFAQSALLFEDLETARNELRKALAFLS